jgi:hypothetical protein
MNQIGCARRQSGPQATPIITWRNQDVTTTLMNPETRMERPEVGGRAAIQSGLPCAGRCGGWHAHCRCRLRAGNRDNAGPGDPSRAPLKSKKALPRRPSTRYNNLMSWPSVYRPMTPHGGGLARLPRPDGERPENPDSRMQDWEESA